MMETERLEDEWLTAFLAMLEVDKENTNGAIFTALEEADVQGYSFDVLEYLSLMLRRRKASKQWADIRARVIKEVGLRDAETWLPERPTS